MAQPNASQLPILPLPSRSSAGDTQMWGSSPAKNLVRFMPDTGDAEKWKTDQFNVLLVGEADLRHSLKTLASNWADCQENKIHFHFYVADKYLDHCARQMVLWILALEALEDKGLCEKTTQFMDIFGNLLIRPQTKKYLLSSVKKLIKFVTGDPDMKVEFPMFDLSFLKNREKDQIADILKFWLKNSDPIEFDVANCWDVRLRQNLGERYDSRFGVFDWDYNMYLLERGTKAGIISLEEYKTWRNTGVAFTEFQGDYSQPNLTLTVSARRPCHQYWGDIQTGPFISHGIECDDDEFFVKSNDKYKKKSFDVTQHNLESIFATISSRTKQERLESMMNASAKPKFTVHFVKMDLCSLSKITENPRFKNHFQLMYFGIFAWPCIQTCDVTQAMSPDCVLIVEDGSFLLELQGQKQKIFNEKIVQIAQHSGLKLVSGEEATNDASDTGHCLKTIKYFKIFKKQLVDGDNVSSVPSPP